MNKKTKLSLVELFTGVPMLKNVLEVLKSKKFVDPGDPRSDGDRIIGVMSPLEKACYAVLNEDIEIRIKALGKCSIGEPSLLCLVLIDREVAHCPFVKELTAVKESLKSRDHLRDFMFALMKSRLVAAKIDVNNVHLRSKFTITTATEMEPPKTIEVFKDFEKLSLEKMLEISIKDTFLESVIETMKSGKFIDESDTLKKGEVVIRKMTDFEKALWTQFSVNYDLGKAKSKELEELVLKSEVFTLVGFSLSIGGGDIDAGSMFGTNDEKHPDVIKANALNAEIKQLKHVIDPLQSLFWKTVKADISKEKRALYDTTSVRKGFQIVMFNED